MNLAVKFYGDTANPEGIPIAWPAEVMELGDSTTLPEVPWILMSEQDLLNQKALHQAEYSAWFASKHAFSLPAYVKGKILAAMNFGKDLMAEYGAANVIAGLTVAQVKQVMVATDKLQSALQSGSLYVALDELASISSPMMDADDPSKVIIADAVTVAFRHKIQTYLGVPLT